MSPWLKRALAPATLTLFLAQATPVFANEYRITLTDLTSGQPFSPPVFVTHDSSLSLWEAGMPASTGIQLIAESGNRGPLVSDLSALVGGSVKSLVTPLSSPLPPGASVTISIQADAAYPFLSSAWMLGRTNDAFAGQSKLDLLGISGTQTFDLFAYDAGTEVNTELATDIGALGGSGRVDENGVIHLSEGIRGIDRLESGLGVDVNGMRTDIPAEWRFSNPVARVTITEVPEPGSVAFLAGVLVSGGWLARRRRKPSQQ